MMNRQKKKPFDGTAGRAPAGCKDGNLPVMDGQRRNPEYSCFYFLPAVRVFNREPPFHFP